MGNLKRESDRLFMPNAGSIDDRGNVSGLFKANKAFMGNPDLPGVSSAPAIRASDLRKSGWTPKSLEYALRTGIMPSGDVLGGSMAEVVQAGTSYLTDADSAAIATYLMIPKDGEDMSGEIVIPAVRSRTMEDMHGMVME